MNRGRLLTLPVEILHTVGDYLTPTTALRSLSLTDKTLNEVYTPKLYESLCLYDRRTAQLCVATLAQTPALTSRGRDLPSYVHSLRIEVEDEDDEKLVDDDQILSMRQLEDAASRMTRLRHFSFHIIVPFTSSLCACLFRTAATTLRSFDVETSSKALDNGDVLLQCSPTCPALVDIRLDLRSYASPRFLSFFHQLVSTHAPQLRTLVIRHWHSEEFYEVLHDVSRFPQLARLEFDVYALDRDGLLDAPELRTLVIYGHHFLTTAPDLMDAVEELTEDQQYSLTGNRGSIHLSPHAFPRLEELHCTRGLLPLFLPPGGGMKRPIRKVMVDSATYWEQGIDCNFALVPQWTAVRRALSYLPNSGVPVQELGITTDNVDLKVFAGEGGLYLKTVEKLVIVSSEDLTEDDAFPDLADALFSQMPHLHTFIISNGVMEQEVKSLVFYVGHDFPLQLKLLKSWGARAPSLRTVSFRNGHIWTKCEHGWTLDIVPVPRRPPRNNGDALM
ncbi:hypothetical protein C8Q77DRAFT_483502 [Trametes polyzona]|nr:hypothetical protein C8Q77DRAFT_483502 [Trametes polyzona]